MTNPQEDALIRKENIIRQLKEPGWEADAEECQQQLQELRGRRQPEHRIRWEEESRAT